MTTTFLYNLFILNLLHKLKDYTMFWLGMFIRFKPIFFLKPEPVQPVSVFRIPKPTKKSWPELMRF